MRFRRARSVAALTALGALSFGSAGVGLTMPAAGPALADTAACMPAIDTGGDADPPDQARAHGFHAIDPVRLLDTRDTGTKTGPGCVMVVDVDANPNVPDDAHALALNVTTVGAPSRGFVTVYPCGSALPGASNVNPRPGDATANSALVQLDETRRVCIYTLTSLHLIVDMTGWFGRFGDTYHAETSVRALDTRTGPRPDAGAGPLAKGVELRLPVAGTTVHGDAVAVAANVTVTDAAESGFATVYPCGQRPPTSTVNFLAGETRANHVLVGLDDSGALCVWSSADAHVLVDIEGWFGGEPGSGSDFRPLLGTRVLDTRDGTGGPPGVPPGILAMDSTISFDPANGARLPIGSTVALNVIATEAAARGYITLFPCGLDRPGTSAVNAEVGTEATNVAFVEVGADSRTCVYVSVPMHVVIDVVGTFGPGGPLHALSLGTRPLGQPFTADAHDYTTRCTTGANAITVHAEGAPGTVVSVAPSTAPAPSATGSVVDQALSLQPNEAFIVRAGPPGATAEEYWVRCLPNDFPVIEVSRTEAPTRGWYLLDAAFPPVGPDPGRYLMILDERSVPVWYRRVAGPAIDLTLMSDGNLAWVKLLGMAFGSTPGGAYEVHSLDGTLVRTVSTVNGPTDHHDIAELPNGDVILVTYVPRDHVDLTALGPGFDSDELVYDNHIEQIRPDGTLAWEWKSEEHIALSEVTFAQRFPGVAGPGVDLVHVNGVSVAPDGDLIVSARHTDAVYKIRRNATGDVVLRVGGTDSDLTFVDDPLDGFARQHDAVMLPNGNLRLFDNRTALGAPRGVEYEIDLVANTATMVWSVTHPAVTASGGVGSVRSAGDGDTVVAWGGTASPAFTEYDVDGNELQTTGLTNRYPYRVDKQPLDAFDIDDLRATAGR